MTNENTNQQPTAGRSEMDLTYTARLITALVEYQTATDTALAGWTVREVWDAVMRSLDHPKVREGLTGSLVKFSFAGLRGRLQTISKGRHRAKGWRVIKARGYQLYNRETHTTHDVRYVCVHESVDAQEYIDGMSMPWAPEGKYIERAARLGPGTARKKREPWPGPILGPESRAGKSNGGRARVVGMLEDALRELQSGPKVGALKEIRHAVGRAMEQAEATENALRGICVRLDEILG